MLRVCVPSAETGETRVSFMIEAIRIVELILHVHHNPPMRAIPTAQAVKPFTFLLRLSHTLRFPLLLLSHTLRFPLLLGNRSFLLLRFPASAP